MQRITHKQSHTGNVIIDAYKLNGTQLWRIDLGRNIRAGAHYTNFLCTILMAMEELKL